MIKVNSLDTDGCYDTVDYDSLNNTSNKKTFLQVFAEAFALELLGKFEEMFPMLWSANSTILCYQSPKGFVVFNNPY